MAALIVGQRLNAPAVTADTYATPTALCAGFLRVRWLEEERKPQWNTANTSDGWGR